LLGLFLQVLLEAEPKLEGDEVALPGDVGDAAGGKAWVAAGLAANTEAGGEPGATTGVGLGMIGGVTCVVGTAAVV